MSDTLKSSTVAPATAATLGGTFRAEFTAADLRDALRVLRHVREKTPKSRKLYDYVRIDPTTDGVRLHASDAYSVAVEVRIVAAGHDGTRAVTIRRTAIRVVCWNTLTASDRSPGALFSVRHTESAEARIGAIGRLIAAGDETRAAFQAAARVRPRRGARRGGSLRVRRRGRARRRGRSLVHRPGRAPRGARPTSPRRRGTP